MMIALLKTSQSGTRLSLFQQTIRFERKLYSNHGISKHYAEGMHMESAAKGGAEMAVEAVNRIGKYSYKNMRSNPKQLINKQELTCYNCGFNVAVTHIKRHIRQECTARASKCKKCGKTGHFARVCKQRLPEDVQQIEPSDFKEENTNDTDDQNLYNINIFRIKASKNRVQPILKSNIVNKKDFRIQVVITNSRYRGQSVSMWHSTSQKMEPVKFDRAIHGEAKTIQQLIHSNCRYC